MADLVAIPEADKAEVWRNTATNKSYIVYYVPGTDIPMLYEASEKELQAIFGPGRTIKYDFQGSTKEFNKTGAMEWGSVKELSNQTDNPFDSWAAAVDAQAEVRPWLRDDEVLSLIASALLEGRTVSEAEFQQTEWWQSHNQAQRQWLLTFEADPSTAKQMMSDARLTVADQLSAYGWGEAPADVINYIADQWITGNWSQTFANAQIKAMTDPYSKIKLDAGLSKKLGQRTPGVDDRETERVRNLVNTWLGPTYGNWKDDQIGRWASRLRNDGDAEEELVATLRKQRLSLFPEYDNESLTYEDIAAPWRNFWSQEWGQSADETDKLFTKVVRMNDVNEAGKLLRSEGLKREVGKVTQDFQTSMMEAFGGQVRGAV